jgi:hypothetical protein
MHRMRSRLTLATLFVACAHVTSIAALSVALCCLPHLGASGETEECPLHRAADDTCTLTQCPMHGADATHAHGRAPADTPTHAHGVATPPSPANECQLRCDDKDRSPIVLAGLPGLLPATVGLMSPDQVTARPTPTVPTPPNHVLPISIPPPRA